MTEKITKRLVDAAKLPPEKAAGPKGSAYIFIWDSELPGFGLKVTATSKTYVAQARVGGKTVRSTIGKHGVFTPDEARVKAKIALGKMSDGINVNSEKKLEAADQITLKELCDRYLKKRKNLSDASVYLYRSMVGTLPPPKKLCLGKRQPALYLRDWKDKPIVSITKEMVEKRHALIGETSKAQANLMMRMLRALFNFAASEFETSEGLPLIAVNPVKRLSQQRTWFEDKRRRTYVKPTDLKAWWDAIDALENDVPHTEIEMPKDYFKLLLLTGLRRNEAARMRWKNVDMKAKTFTVRDTKNGEDHVLPMSDYLFEIFTRRQEAAVNEFVFPGDGGKGHTSGPRWQLAFIRERSGVNFTLHDLRRTFGTIAESLDIPAYALKRLLNHKMKNDVTFNNYLQIDVERLRQPMQKITDYVLKAVGKKEGAEVVAIPAAGSASAA